MSVRKTSQLMLYREIIAVCSQTHTKHINTLCGQNVQLLTVKPDGTYSNHCGAVKQLTTLHSTLATCRFPTARRCTPAALCRLSPFQSNIRPTLLVHSLRPASCAESVTGFVLLGCVELAVCIVAAWNDSQFRL